MKQKRILVVDDDQFFLDSLCDALENAGYFSKGILSGKTALQELKNESYDLVLTDLSMPKMGGIEVTRKVKKYSPQTEVIVVTGNGQIKSAVEAMRHGAYDYIEKLDINDMLLPCVEQAINNLCARSDETHNLEFPSIKAGEIIGDSPSIKKAIQLVEKVAKWEIWACNVLILGESGTGKELFAQAIHQWGARPSQPFIDINCAAIPPSLAETELFGIEKGIASQVEKRSGKFEDADGGILFLDEIGDLEPALQTKMLRAIELSEITRVGGKCSIKVDLRIVSATSVNLEEAVEKGAFKAALLHRLNTITIHVPPLREHRQDIPLLVTYFLGKYKKPSYQIKKDAVDLLKAYNWPGNVRQLEKVIHRALIVSKDNTIETEDLPEKIQNYHPFQEKHSSDSLHSVTKNHIDRILEEENGNIHATAKKLEISRPTLYSMMKRLGIDRSIYEK